MEKVNSEKDKPEKVQFLKETSEHHSYGNTFEKKNNSERKFLKRNNLEISITNKNIFKMIKENPKMIIAERKFLKTPMNKEHLKTDTSEKEQKQQGQLGKGDDLKRVI